MPNVLESEIEQNMKKENDPKIGSYWLMDKKELSQTLHSLSRLGYTLVGPSVRDGAIVYEEIQGVEDLPESVTDEQAPGRYQLKKRADKALFGYVVGPHSWKKYLFLPEMRLLCAEQNGETLRFFPEPLPRKRYAFIAVRSCELAAIEIQDKVFAAEPYSDPSYAALREKTFILSVQCTESKSNCFCTSMGTGPRARRGFDLALTERILEDPAENRGARRQASSQIGGRVEWVLEVGTERGAQVLSRIPRREASESDVREAEEAVKRCAKNIKKQMNTEGIRECMASSLEHPRWEDVAKRCLSCANCTMVCPTCFCFNVEETGDLTGRCAQRWRRWDSCFTNDHSYLHGGSVRPNTRSKYRQWLTHKLANWTEQYGVSGCVGCGRCITWCPVGIDLTEEVRAIRENNAAGKSVKAASEGKR